MICIPICLPGSCRLYLNFWSWLLDQWSVQLDCSMCPLSSHTTLFTNDNTQQIRRQSYILHYTHSSDFWPIELILGVNRDTARKLQSKYRSTLSNWKDFSWLNMQSIEQSWEVRQILGTVLVGHCWCWSVSKSTLWKHLKIRKGCSCLGLWQWVEQKILTFKDETYARYRQYWKNEWTFMMPSV